jgi:glucuronoarabinoxylan endo-1,4-beta-xylanase
MADAPTVPALDATFAEAAAVGTADPPMTTNTPVTYSRDIKYFMGKPPVEAKKSVVVAKSIPKIPGIKALSCFSPPVDSKANKTATVSREARPETRLADATAREVLDITGEDDVFQARGTPKPKSVIPSQDHSSSSKPAVDLVSLTPPAGNFLARALPSFASTNSSTGSITLRMDQVKQTITGIGFSNAFWTSRWHYHADKDELYRLMFQELQPSIIRLRNLHNLTGSSQRDMQIDFEFLESSKKWLDYYPEVLLTSWTPPTYLKADGQLNGGRWNSTLSKDSQGRFRYDDYAQWWLDSINVYRSLGIRPRWISHQNEPDFNAPHTSCLFGAQESNNVPGYYTAATKVFNKIHSNLASPPSLIGPEGFGAESYLSEHPFGNGGIFSAFACHLYATTGNNSRDPYSYNAALARVKETSAKKQIQEVWMSEFAFLRTHEYQDPMRLAIVIHNSLTVADMTAYLHWDGLWASGFSEGTLVLVDQGKGYKILQSFYFFQHFSRFIRPGYRRVQVDVGIKDVLASAWTGPAGAYSIILINTSSTQVYVSIRDMPVWIANQITLLYFSTLDQKFTYAGVFRGDSASLLPNSITTIHTKGDPIEPVVVVSGPVVSEPVAPKLEDGHCLPGPHPHTEYFESLKK